MTQLSLDWLREAGFTQVAGKLEAQATKPAAPRARRSDPETSKRAADAASAFVAGHEGKIYGALFDAGARGATYREIAQATGMEPVAVARRLKSMESRNLIKRRFLANSEYHESRNGMAVWWKA